MCYLTRTTHVLTTVTRIGGLHHRARESIALLMSVTSQEPALSGAIHIIDSVRVQQNATLDDVRAQISARRFFWLDICAVEASLASYAGDWVTRSIRRRGEPAFR